MDGWPRRVWCSAVIAACLAAALGSTWPLALHLASAVPLGTESAATIPVFDVWTLWWSAERLAHGYADLWNAPIFHPAQAAFTFSEPLLLPGALAAPLFWLHAPPAFAHNFVLLTILCLNGMFGCRLVRALGVPRLPALLAAVLVTTLPFFAKVQGELPILAIGGTLAALDGVVRFGEDGRIEHAAAAAAGIVVQGLSCQQLALFSLLFVGAAGIVALAEREFARASVVRLASAALGAGVLLYLIARTPMNVHEELGFGRTDDLVQSLSAKPLDFLSRPASALLSFPPREDGAAYTGGLFPGVLLLGLAGFGAAAPWPDARRNRWRWYALGSCVVAFFLALGLNLSLAGWQPFATLRRLPGFGEVRSAFRCAVFVQIHLVILAAFGLAALGTRLHGSPRARAAVLGAGLFAAIENLSTPAPLLALPTSARTPWSSYIAGQPPGTVVAHVPFPKGGNVEDLAPEAWRMFAQLDHRQPLVNGYASNFPALHREFMFAMGEKFPEHMLACALRRVFDADLLVVDQDWLSAHQERFAELATMLEPTYADATVAIFRLEPSMSECPPMRIDLGRK
jgi:hypothetical protein